MKKNLLIVFGLSMVCILVTFYNSAYEFGWVSTEIVFLQQLELFTFALNHLFVLICFIQSIRIMKKTHQIFYLVTMLIPLALLVFSWYLFFVRVLNLFFT